MPFIEKFKREVIDKHHSLNECSNVQVGDRCYFFYKQMVDRWKISPRWGTAHEIYRDMVDDCKEGEYTDAATDDCLAHQLAWQCFFYFHVLKYEEQKRNENGDI